MLVNLQIRDFVIADHLVLDFQGGMSALTGETGAGKSILVDALGLLLGDRADSSVVRGGADKAELNAVFDLDRLPEARAWLRERDLGDEDECHLRRLIGREARSRAYINGTPQPLQMLREFGAYLVDIHGQHEHQSLLRRELQRQLLDDYAGNQTLLEQVGRGFRHWQGLQRRLRELSQAQSEREARLDLLRYQVNELDALALGEEELPALEDEHRRLANAGRLLEVSQQSLDGLYESEELAVHGLLGRITADLESLLEVDGRLQEVVNLLGSAVIQIQEGADELRRYLQGIDLDPERLAWLEQRLADIQTLSRKHRCAPEELPGLLQTLRTELDQLEHGEEHAADLERQLAQARRDYDHQARDLGRRREQAAAALGDKVTQAMQELGMVGGRLTIQLERLDKPSAFGQEAVEFLVSANPGQAPQPLARVASGGELSRISLAIQVISADAARIPTLVFDEVDTGIGGGIAEVVGRQLRTLGAARQVLCVTHLPQVAAQAHHHFRVSKRSRQGSTTSHIQALDPKQRVSEVARMLGGLELTDNTLAHAREMIHLAQGQGASIRQSADR